MNNDIREKIEYYFSEIFEKEIEANMMYYDYVFPKEQVVSYINDINSIPLDCIVEYIMEDNTLIEIKAKDVVQFSNFDDATFRLCNELLCIDNPGVTALDAGKLLLNDEKKRNDGAYLKYGENHVKTGKSMGLLCEISNTYYVNTIGYVINDLDQESKVKLLERLILRNALIRRLFNATNNGNVNVREFLYMLSDSTYIRRRSNIRKILSILEVSMDYNFCEILIKIVL